MGQVSSPPRPLLRAETWAADELARNFLAYFPADALRLAAETVLELYQAATAAPKTAEAPMARPAGTEWHPLLNAVEHTPGVWTMVESTGREYGVVRIVREGATVVYVGERRGQTLGGATSSSVRRSRKSTPPTFDPSTPRGCVRGRMPELPNASAVRRRHLHWD